MGLDLVRGRAKHGNAPRPPNWPPSTAEQVARFPATFGIERALTS